MVERHTDNLVIRKSIWEDIDIFYRWESLPEVTKFFSIEDGQTKEAVIRKYIENDSPRAEQWTILLKQASSFDKPIGRIVITDIEPGWKAELWRIYIGDLEERGRGYGKESMECIMRHCFDNLNLTRLYLDHYTGNPAGRLYEKLGFSYEGVLRKNCKKNGKLYDVHLMSILRDEFQEGLL